MSRFEKEWEILQNQFDSYEKFSLIIKCLAVTLSVVCVIAMLPMIYQTLIMCVLWFQDAIWKTFQSRIEQRLYVVEKALALSNSDNEKPFQFNQQFSDNRPNQLGLIKLYLSQSIRPTVAFPYLVLIAMTFVL